jgi:hypothetical protein
MKPPVEHIIDAFSLIFEPQARHIRFRLNENTKLEYCGSQLEA